MNECGSARAGLTESAICTLCQYNNSICTNLALQNSVFHWPVGTKEVCLQVQIPLFSNKCNKVLNEGTTQHFYQLLNAKRITRIYEFIELIKDIRYVCQNEHCYYHCNLVHVFSNFKIHDTLKTTLTKFPKVNQTEVRKWQIHTDFSGLKKHTVQTNQGLVKHLGNGGESSTASQGPDPCKIFAIITNYTNHFDLY